jgi:hypothetical protein
VRTHLVECWVANVRRECPDRHLIIS